MRWNPKDWRECNREGCTNMTVGISGVCEPCRKKEYWRSHYKRVKGKLVKLP